MKRLLFSLLAATTSALASDANRLAYLDDDSPFWPTPKSPKFITPQWIGEPGVEAAVILSVDDLRDDPAKWEAYVRPVLERLKQIDGRAPFSIFCCKFDPAHPQFQTWLKEGVSLEVHTIDHPCPCLGKMDFAAASRTTHDGVDLLARIPGNRPVAFRMPCCDSMNSSSPRFFAEILSGKSAEGRWLSASSSVSMIFTGGENRARFAKYQPTEMRPPVTVTFDRYAGDIQDYPYPYVIGRKCIEFPFVVPSDWQGYNAIGARNPQMTADWKAALDTTVAKQGLMTLVVHPHGWSDPAQLVELVEYAVEKYGNRVKFLNIREALERIEKYALNDYRLRHPLTGDDVGVRLLDVNGDGFMDVMIGNNQREVTRLWEPHTQRWIEVKSPTPFQTIVVDGPRVEHHVRFGQVRGATTMLSNGAWEWDGEKWKSAPELMKGLPAGFGTGNENGDAGVRFRDFDNDGGSELLVNRDIFRWKVADKKWEPAGFSLPDGCGVVDEKGRDNGLRFVDLNGDGFDDIFQSNERGHAIHLWAAHVRNDLGWTRGWSHQVSVSSKAPEELSDAVIPPFVKDGKNYGAWFHKGHAVWQNEDTAKLEGVVVRRSFKDLIAVPIPPIKTPAESQKCFVPRPGFTVELVASEPLVESPVAFEWDAQGRLWVVEMRDYPTGMDGKGAPGGRIKILTDEDADGHYDKATLFADDLPFPTGLHPWRDGVVVAAVPDILFLRDKDGDGKADERGVLFTGFTPGNQQHRMNGFEWGLDGWLHGANGDSGGKIIAAASGQPGPNPVSISGRDFRFHPETLGFEAESGQTQYGRRRDDWGNWFGNNNPTWLWHYTIEDRYLRRNPRLAVKSVRQVTNRDTRVFPAYALEDAPTRLNQPQSLGHATSANSPTPYRDELFGPDFATSVFISEPMYNVVHREVLAPDGATFTSNRAADETEREFLASTDLWFRPTMLKTGPDGALYIADMHRFTLEHPEWIAPETLSRLDVRAGANRGRIWRVKPSGAKLRATPNLAALEDAALVAALDSPNGWQRDTAQRLLFEQKAQAAAPALRQLFPTVKNPKVRVQILATLAVLNAIDDAAIRTGIRDPDPAVRACALRVGESRAAEILPTLFACLDDPDFTVRRQLALTLGTWRDERATIALAQLAERDGAQDSMRIAIMSSLPADHPLFAKLNTAPAASGPVPILPKPTTTDRAKVIASYASAGELKGDAARGHTLFQQQCAICHRLKAEGHELGPDLGMVAGKSLDWLLAAIFDPNAAIEPRYQAQHLKLTTGAEFTGIVVAETGNNLTLRLPGGSEQAILRSDLAAQTSLRKSMMPEGLETVIKPQDLADILAALRDQ